MTSRLKTHITRASGFSRTDAVIVCCAVSVLVILLVAISPNNTRREAPQFNEMSKLRHIHQGMITFAQDNNTYLPGLDANGHILPANAPEFAGTQDKGNANRLTGASMSARYYLLLKGKFLEGNNLLFYKERNQRRTWSAPESMPTTEQFSYTLLRIGDSPTATTPGRQAGRVAEWIDNANSQSILATDRNTASSPASDKVRSLWSDSWGSGADWKGFVLWGDNHSEYLQNPNARLGTANLNTKYGSTINSDDFLFGESALPGKSATASAMFGYTSDNF